MEPTFKPTPIPRCPGDQPGIQNARKHGIFLPAYHDNDYAHHIPNCQPGFS